jgi:hypothetical protein
MMRQIQGVMLVTLVLSAAACSGPQRRWKTGDGKPFVGRDFTVDMPEDWEQPAHIPDITFAGAAPGTNDTTFMYVSLGNIPDGTGRREFLEEMLQDIRGRVGKLSVKDIEVMKKHGLYTKRIRFSASQGAGTLEGELHLFVDGKAVYGIEYYSLPENFETYKPVYDQVVESFRLK